MRRHTIHMISMKWFDEPRGVRVHGGPGRCLAYPPVLQEDPRGEDVSDACIPTRTAVDDMRLPQMDLRIPGLRIDTSLFVVGILSMATTLLAGECAERRGMAVKSERWGYQLPAI
ncbi:hypothetical protein VUR80DRAFT_7110 [Thermomyces stellatus]